MKESPDEYIEGDHALIYAFKILQWLVKFSISNEVLRSVLLIIHERWITMGVFWDSGFPIYIFNDKGLRKWTEIILREIIKN